mmetsp:Transcript_62192/g.196767  ORF Transcript_62192/g.196767 Transcript_62192/m.196767 type:complete len:271 (-) Transcript_62192:2839-3651(-)
MAPAASPLCSSASRRAPLRSRGCAPTRRRWRRACRRRRTRGIGLCRAPSNVGRARTGCSGSSTRECACMPQSSKRACGMLRRRRSGLSRITRCAWKRCERRRPLWSIRCGWWRRRGRGPTSRWTSSKASSRRPSGRGTRPRRAPPPWLPSLLPLAPRPRRALPARPPSSHLPAPSLTRPVASCWASTALQKGAAAVAVETARIQWRLRWLPRQRGGRSLRSWWLPRQSSRRRTARSRPRSRSFAATWCRTSGRSTRSSRCCTPSGSSPRA